MSLSQRQDEAPIDRWLKYAGEWLMRHQRAIRALQWGVVGIYILLIGVPVVLPLPTSTAHIWNNVTLFAQFMFWGIWWPFVLLSMVLVGRLWCGALVGRARLAGGGALCGYSTAPLCGNLGTDAGRPCGMRLLGAAFLAPLAGRLWPSPSFASKNRRYKSASLAL